MFWACAESFLHKREHLRMPNVTLVGRQHFSPHPETNPVRGERGLTPAGNRKLEEIKSILVSNYDLHCSLKAIETRKWYNLPCLFVTLAICNL